MSCGTDIYCFADSGARVGSGHIFRTYPVLQALLQADVTGCMMTPVRRRKISEMQLSHTFPANAKVFSRAILEERPCAVVLDSYRQRKLLIASARQNPVLLFDDHYAPPPGASLIVNASPSATCGRYSNCPGALLGPKYASLHGAFAAARAHMRIRKKSGRIFVALGGNDTGGNLASVVRLLLKAVPVAELIVCGAPGSAIPANSRVVRREWLNQAEVAELMASSDLAVLAGGQMLVQAACLGLPAVAIPQSSHQALHAADWKNLGSVIVADTPADAAEAARRISLADRARMSVAGRKVVDGKGATRIARSLISLRHGIRK